ncbi:hypothetical protein [Flavobacterium sp.]|uniref:hypothetical protein n=1 Tax=Flavobacterium sp. TaxID=239 RepID=UPI002629E45C|nr:hypothetical protein [Flavobacterium sp.]
MQVIAHEPYFWFFLQHNNNYYLDVNCSYSFVGYNRLIQLNETEVKEYLERGTTYINELANEIQYSLQPTYSERHLMGEIDDLVHQAITEFNATKDK